MEGTTGTGAARVVTTIARPLVIIVGGVGMALLLRSLAPDRFGGSIGDGFDRVREFLPPTIELAVVGVLLALVAAVPLGLAARSSPVLERIVGIGAILSSITAPAVVLISLLYWLAIQAGLPVFGWTPLSEDVGDHLRRLILPALTIAAVMAMPLASVVRDTVNPWRRRSLGLEAVAASVANRSAPGSVRLMGLPMGLLLLSLFTVELGYGIPGLAGLSLRSVQALDLNTGLAALIVMIVVGALFSLAIDLVGLVIGEPDDAAAPPPAPGSGPVDSSSGAVPALAVGGALLLLLVVASVIGRVTGSPGLSGRPGEGILSDGHLLGTNRLGVDRLHQMAFSLGPYLLRSFLVSLVPTMVAVVLAAVGRTGKSTVRSVIGLIVDVFWWPLVPMLFMAALAFGAFSTFSPSVLIIFSLGLIPVATRLATREFALRKINPAGIGGLLFLLMGWAAMVDLTFGATGGLRFDSWPGLLFESQVALGVDTASGVIIGLGTMLVLAAIQLTGLGLLGLGRRSSATAPVAVAAPGVSVPGGQPPAFPPPSTPSAEPAFAAPPGAAPPPAGVPPAEAPTISAPPAAPSPTPPATQPPSAQPPPVVGAPSDPSRQTISVPPPVEPPTDTPIAPAPPEPPVRPPDS